MGSFNHGNVIAQCSSNSSLENRYHWRSNECLPISSGAGQHLVDADDMEWMQSHSDMELILSAELDEVLVAANTSGFQGFGAQLFILVRHEMHAQREVIDESLLATEIEDTDFRVWHTAAETRLRVRLIFTVTIAKTREIFGYSGSDHQIDATVIRFLERTSH